MNIIAYRDQFQQEVSDLILSIQRDELGIKIAAEDQPDLKNIPSVYQRGTGNFWIAETGGRVAGTIALIDIGNDDAALRKMFVRREYRGKELNTAALLMGHLLEWCHNKKVKTVYLGTIDIMKAAHRFYEKNRFCRIAKDALPDYFPVMPVDNVFYKYSLGENS